MKSAKLHLVKFLFVLPLMAVLLLAFRSKTAVKPFFEKTHSIASAIAQQAFHKSAPDTLPVTSKGNLIEVIDEKGNCTIVLKDKNNREIKRILLTKWKQQKEYYDNLYGSLPENLSTAKSITSYKIDIDDNSRATVTTENGTVEKFDLNDEIEKKEFAKKYGMETTDSPGKNAVTTDFDTRTEGTTLPVIMGETLTVKNIATTTSLPAKETSHGVNESATETNNLTYVAGDTDKPKNLIYSGIKIENVTQGSLPPVTVTGKPGSNSRAAEGKDDQLQEVVVTGYKVEPAVLAGIALKIESNTSLQELGRIANDLKKKGFEFKIDKTTYHNGKLSYLKGSLEKNGIKKSFTAVDFLEFMVLDNSNQGINDFNFWINGGNLTWE